MQAGPQSIAPSQTAVASGDRSELLGRAMGLLALLCLGLAVLLTLPPSAQAAECPNEAIRAQQGTAALTLPDCRAYELVSPGSIPSVSAETKLDFGGGKAAPDGNALSYYSRYPALGSETSSETWLSKRTANGWIVTSLDPQMTPNPTKKAVCQPGVALSENLDAYLLSAGGELYSSEIPSVHGECSKPAEELIPGEPRGYANLYLRVDSSPWALVNPVPVGVTPNNATYQAASSDLSKVVFSESAQLTPESPPGYNLFEWADGVVHLIGILPTGEPVPAKLAAATRSWNTEFGPQAGLAPVSHAVSADGERVFFEANGNLYLRANATQPPAATADCRTSEPGLACTLQLDRSSGAGASGGGVFQFASRDGERVFFTSDHALTFPSSAVSGKPDLYEYNVSTNELVDLTVASSGSANVRGISGGSDDGSHLYFVARGVLTGSEQNAQGEVAQAGQPNIYLVRDRSLTYVATLSPWTDDEGGRDKFNWWETARLKTAWSPSGQYLVFSSFKSLTGFDNTPEEVGVDVCEDQPTCEELFLYDADAEDLSCVSCDPGGAKPVANTRLVMRQEFQRFTPGPRYAPRVVLDSGQVFFETENPLSARDVNGFQDVYEYRAGNLNLISSGTGQGGSGFVDASANGSNVFFVAPDALVPSDTEGVLSVYDARVGGGFAEPLPPPAPCAGEDSCRSSGPVSPPSSAAGTHGFVGPGNVRPRRCKKGKVRRGGRCVKKKAHRRYHRQRNASSRQGRKG